MSKLSLNVSEEINVSARDINFGGDCHENGI
jgi:hypothetical protein